MPDADVYYYPNWLDLSIADDYLIQLKTNLAWSQDYIRIYGKDVKIPRLQCWMGDADAITDQVIARINSGETPDGPEQTEKDTIDQADPPKE